MNFWHGKCIKYTQQCLWKRMFVSLDFMCKCCSWDYLRAQPFLSDFASAISLRTKRTNKCNEILYMKKRNLKTDSAFYFMTSISVVRAMFASKITFHARQFIWQTTHSAQHIHSFTINAEEIMFYTTRLTKKQVKVLCQRQRLSQKWRK